MRRADIEVPNHPVDMDSWGRSACYPRGTFYPLSDTASTCRCRITSPDFRPCSTCQSHSQAPLCTYTQHLIANQAEGTFGRLRYLLGGNAPVKLPTRHGPRTRSGSVVRHPNSTEWYFKIASTWTGVHTSQAPTYPTQLNSNANVKL